MGKTQRETPDEAMRRQRDGGRNQELNHVHHSLVRAVIDLVFALDESSETSGVRCGAWIGGSPSELPTRPGSMMAVVLTFVHA